MTPYSRNRIEKYCKEHNVGMIFFTPDQIPSKHLLTRNDFFLKGILPKQNITQLKFNPKSSIPYVAKTCVTINQLPLPKHTWTTFGNNKYFESVLSAVNSNNEIVDVVIKDTGHFDDIEKVIIGGSLNFWSIQLAFHDAVLYFDNRLKGKFDLDRFVQIDIDDMFVGQLGTRIVRNDVDAMIETQTKLRERIEGFTFNVGFSGYYFRRGNELEQRGDEYLVEMKDNFNWFPHMWKHNHAQDHDLQYLKAVMVQNRLFADNFKLPLVEGYAISPQHGGVYPIIDHLYIAWKQIWGTNLTSTEEYPHFKPMGSRRAFEYMNVSVLPRQTCGLYTHTLYYHSYPDGFKAFLQNIFGGQLFGTLLMNPFNIFMTHQQNYAHDRLADYTFRNAIDFFKCYTNLNFKYIHPQQMRNMYLERFLTEKKIVWTNACDDPRHVKMVVDSSKCNRTNVPNLIILGPQKTGTTAIGTFLSLHPNVSTNDNLVDSFEEVQFFSNEQKYEKGPEWYFDLFKNANSTHQIIFEKTGNYFDHPLAPKRVFSLMPKATLAIILKDPVLRAYSWYQHIKSHNDSVASKFTFEQVMLGADSETSKLKSRCIIPGKYAFHLIKWLHYYQNSKIIIIDSDQMINNPVKVMAEFTKKLALKNYDFSEAIKFNQSKGYFCANINKQTKCLGKSKGRKYDTLGEELKLRLDVLYKNENKILYDLLKLHKFSIPGWLVNIVKD
uniref:[heparan sulfate]-glucosamine N-sulfotransferase n=1 Tax=Rhabditophanes sp. KR3021 TaxID=114890 RepID=A0AC35TKZ8_9BILA